MKTNANVCHEVKNCLVTIAKRSHLFPCRTQKLVTDGEEDTDNDGYTNDEESDENSSTITDKDNDGVSDVVDPADTDGDGI
uniref:hypothetical protein n=1 Tax=Staphylococcus chromogenes TaxID=46126 RepID=UPI0034DAE8B4